MHARKDGGRVGGKDFEKARIVEMDDDLCNNTDVARLSTRRHRLNSRGKQGDALEIYQGLQDLVPSQAKPINVVIALSYP